MDLLAAAAALQAHGRDELFSRLSAQPGGAAPPKSLRAPPLQHEPGVVGPLPLTAMAGNLPRGAASSTIVAVPPLNPEPFVPLAAPMQLDEHTAETPNPPPAVDHPESTDDGLSTAPKFQQRRERRRQQTSDEKSSESAKRKARRVAAAANARNTAEAAP